MLVLAKAGGADTGETLVAFVRPSLALWVVPVDPGVLTSPSSVVTSSSSSDGSESGTIDSDKKGHSNECQLKYKN